MDHPKARHWCSAFRGIVVTDTSEDGHDDDQRYDNRLGDSTILTERCNDDGEPNGTAGQPILNALQTEGNLVNVVCVVVRYFGGIKLGTGGLIRAYGSAARQVLNDAPQSVLVPISTLVASCIAPHYVGSVYDVVSKFGASTANEIYHDCDNGSLTLSILCERRLVEQLRDTLKDITRGTVKFGTLPT
jgi:putative IMPACT (imprinted ancient) family translation regulator